MDFWLGILAGTIIEYHAPSASWLGACAGPVAGVLIAAGAEWWRHSGRFFTR